MRGSQLHDPGIIARLAPQRWRLWGTSVCLVADDSLPSTLAREEEAGTMSLM